jgi:hypothetical protein
MTRALALLMLPLIISISASATDLSGQVIAVIDGNTISLKSLSHTIKVRLLAVAPPEPNQPYADVARQHLTDLILRKFVVVRYTGIGDRGYLVGRILLEQADVNAQMLREMTQREDWIPQNHMGSVVLVRPGILRTALFRAGHRGLGLMLRAVATDGYLGSMRTIHFAHWAFVSNGSRLMFFSNFDHSWDSYLDDFIEKAHGGLTLAWGSGVGFPPTRFLVLDGASHGRQFKNWARHSMAVSRFWYSAYRDFTVDQIERNARIANGLRKETLNPKEATAWARDL